MYLLSILIAVGMSLIQFSTKTNFSEMKIASTRADLAENILFMQRDFQSSDKIFISDEEYRDMDGELTENKSDAATETKRLFIKKGNPLFIRDDKYDFDGDGIPDVLDKDDDNDGIPDKTDTDDDNDGILDEFDEVKGISIEQFVSYRIEKNYNTKNTVLYYDGDKNKYWLNGSVEIVLENDRPNKEDTYDPEYDIYKYICPTNSNRVKDVNDRPTGSFLASLVYYEDGIEDKNTLERYDSRGSNIGYKTGRTYIDGIDYDFDKFTNGQLKNYGSFNGVGIISTLRQDIIKGLQINEIYGENFKQVKLNFVIEKYEGAKEGNSIDLTMSSRLNTPILKCEVIDEP